MVLSSTGPVSMQEMRDEIGTATGTVSMSQYLNSNLAYFHGVPGVPAAGPLTASTLTGKSSPNRVVTSSTWPSLMTTNTMYGSYSIASSGTSPDVQYMLTSSSVQSSGNSVYRQDAVQFATSFKCSFDIFINSSGTGDAMWFFCGSTGVPPYETASVGGYQVIFDAYSGFYGGSGRSGVGIYLCYGGNTNYASATIVASAAFSVGGAWQPVTVTYTKGTTNTWVVNWNGTDVITYSDANNATWLASSGAYWGVGGRNGGATADFGVRRINMSHTGGAVRPPITSGLIGHYIAESHSGSTWYDLSGSGNNASTGGTIKINPIGINGRGYIYGGTSASVTFPAAILPSTYTLFHVCRYNGTNNGRIITNISGASQNWLSGFHGGRNGVAYHGDAYQWVTAYTNKFPTNTWIISTDQTGLYRGNKINFTTNATGAATRIGINSMGAEQSDWACAAVLVYNRALSADEILSVEDWLGALYRPPVCYPPYRMTANTSSITGQPFGNGTYIASASSVVVTSQPESEWMPFDDTPGSYWTVSSHTLYNNGAYAGSQRTTVSGTDHGGEWLQLQLPSPITISMYFFRTHPNDSARGPNTWVLAGSTDGVTWTLVDSRSGLTSTTSTVYIYSVLNPGRYSYFRFITKNIQGNVGENWHSLAELKFLSLSPTTWTPDRIVGLQNWHSADSGLTLVSNNVSRWNDLSGNGNHLLQATSGNRPSYNQAAVNSKPAIVFGGTTGVLLTGPSAGSGITQFTMAVVVYNSLKSTFAQIFSTNGAWASGSVHVAHRPGLQSIQVTVNPGGDTYPGYTATDNVPYILVLTGSISGGTATMNTYVNGSTLTSSTVALSSFNLSNIDAGGWSGDTGRTLNGGIQALLVYSYALSTSNRQLLEGYLAWRWLGSGSSLVDGHPYKSSFAAVSL